MSSLESKHLSHPEKLRPGAAVLLGALGVVFGDIGTSPLYAVKVSLSGFASLNEQHILGVLSLLIWLLTLVVSIKYVVCIMRADNQGEGGVLALMELAKAKLQGRRKWIYTTFGLIGASLFYGDSVITPAISVMSAVEGLGVVSHTLEGWVVPLSLLILACLFAIQSYGTGAMGKLFGPVMALWFVVIGALGLWRIVQTPQVLQALNPVWAVQFIAEAPWEVFLLLGAIVLAVTGAEALYVDMGHFGRSAIRRVWFGLVMPCLAFAYLGQGALLLRDPAAIKNPFFLLAPDFMLLPLIVLAAIAAIIASQAVISGAFSLTRQAVQLGYWPRMQIEHTSASTEGQIYLPRVNFLLFLAVMLLVIGFGSADRLAHAYGFAVTGTMLMTSLLAFRVLPLQSSGFRRLIWLVSLTVFLVIDVLLFSSNTLKVFEGGWLPLGIGLAIFTLMITWNLGREKLHEALSEEQHSLAEFMQSLEDYPPVKVPGTAVFMSMLYGTVPPALLHNLKHNKVLHEQVLFVTVQTARVPYVPFHERYEIERLNHSSWQVQATWGFKQEPNVPQMLEQLAQDMPEINLEPLQISFFMSRQTVLVVRKLPLIARFQRRIFAFMARNATRSTRFYKIPPNRVVEMGMQQEI
ncbi:potassium transporter Kup [Pollutimonas harenae]|uniref:Probable potassium transport system protein Kup n=1 Tax=Pollutimonas harenae TaxID=657015 RepID=A0A853H6S5_9BURK|nr:potassium transporter Kup [Pollutimonas harenae]NYT85804.1 potassium transporter Kup [Pollutimonas harenae]TEA70866.1 potassium transporter Kup [Pollutimonas harenae]